MSSNSTLSVVRHEFSKSVYSGLLRLRTVILVEPSLGLYIHIYVTQV